MERVRQRFGGGCAVVVMLLSGAACGDTQQLTAEPGETVSVFSSPSSLPESPTTEVTTTEVTTTEVTTTEVTTTEVATTEPATAPPTTQQRAKPAATSSTSAESVPPATPGIRLTVKGPSAGPGCPTECYWLAGTMTGYGDQWIHFSVGSTMLCSTDASDGVYFKVCPIEVGTMAGAVFVGRINVPIVASNSVTIPG